MFSKHRHDKYLKLRERHEQSLRIQRLPRLRNHSKPNGHKLPWKDQQKTSARRGASTTETLLYGKMEFNTHPRWVQPIQYSMYEPEVNIPTGHGQEDYAPPDQRAQVDLAKMYRDDQKYSGHVDDILDEKLNIFYDHCDKVNIRRTHYKYAFSTMLKGEALSY